MGSPSPLTWAVVALSSAGVVATLCPAQGITPSTAPRFQLRADTVMVDEPVGVVLSGLPPGREATIRVNGLGSARGWQGRATFRADDRGRIDIATMAPVAGMYRGVHPMGLFWAANHDSAAAPLLITSVRTPDVTPPALQPWELRAELDDRVVATDTVWRRAVAPDVRIVPIRERGLVGTLYIPPGGGRHPAVVVLNGSQGGIAPPESFPGGLASRGFVVLALGYFAAEGLPRELRGIPLEYFGTALDWLGTHPAVDSARVGVLGQSRGAELALLVAATYPRVRAVVAYVPSNVVWPGTLADSTRAAAWTLAGKPVPGMYGRESEAAVADHAGCSAPAPCPTAVTRHRFLALLDDSTAVASAEIPVERINGPVLLLSAEEDGLWPSAAMAERIVARLRRRGFAHPMEHRAYEGAGHAIARPYIPTPDVAVARRSPITGLVVTPGGTPAGTALASADSWPRVLAFLSTHLGAAAPDRSGSRKR